MSLIISNNRALLYDENSNTAFSAYVNNATSQKVGVVKPDGSTTSVNNNGVLSANGCWQITYANDTLSFSSL